MDHDQMNPGLHDGPPPCRNLKTKALYVHDQFASDMQRSSSTAHYYCLHSMQPFGPDGEFVCPEECHSGRACFAE